jgi:molecular chaperone GrpE
MTEDENTDPEGKDVNEKEAEVDLSTEEEVTSAAEGEIEALKDQLLRTVAESENIRRRASRDVENAHKYANEKLLEDLLPVLDSLEKALELPDQSDDAKAVLEGIEISLRMFRETLERGGVLIVDPLGEPFDPSKHEALAMVPNEEVEPNSVIEVVQKGYLLNERVVRAARVVVSAAS